jgi:organic radical activating enzyme
MPTFVQLRVTNLCNLRCPMCGQWGSTGIYRSDRFPAAATDGERERSRIKELIGLKRQLALAEYVRLLDEIAPFQPIVSLFGGEPFLYPDLLPLVREVKKRGGSWWRPASTRSPCRSTGLPSSTTGSVVRPTRSSGLPRGCGRWRGLARSSAERSRC